MQQAEPTHRFPSRIAVRVPLGLPEAVEAAARIGLTSPSEWTRRALLAALKDNGVVLAPDGRVVLTEGQA